MLMSFMERKKNKMIISATCTINQVGPNAPIIYRGELETVLANAKEAGYGGVEMHIRDSEKIDKGLLKDSLDRFGLELTSIGTGEAYNKDHLFLSSEDKDVRQEAVERICGHIRHAKDYRHAVVILGLVRGKTSNCSSRKAYEECLLEGLKACAEEAEKYGVYMGMEMINRYECDDLNRIEEGEALIEKVGSRYLGIHIDTYHMNIEEADIRQAIVHAKDKIVHVHAADNDRWYPGHGHIDFESFGKVLEEISYPWAVAVECRPFPDGLTAGKLAAENLKKWVH